MYKNEPKIKSTKEINGENFLVLSEPNYIFTENNEALYHVNAFNMNRKSEVVIEYSIPVKFKKNGEECLHDFTNEEVIIHVLR